MRAAEAWVALTTLAIDKFKERRQAESNGEEYSGPVTDRAYKALSRMADMDTRQRLFKPTTLAGKEVQLMSLIFTESLQKARDVLLELEADYPSNIAIVGAFDYDTGLEIGVSYTYDAEGNITGTTGTPEYPLPNWLWKLMPDNFDGYDGNEDPIYTPLTSNTDIRPETINKIMGQADRQLA